MAASFIQKISLLFPPRFSSGPRNGMLFFQIVFLDMLPALTINQSPLFFEAFLRAGGPDFCPPFGGKGLSG